MQHTAFALRTVWYIYIVKTAQLQGKSHFLHPLREQRSAACVSELFKMRGVNRGKREGKTGKSAVVSMVGSVHLMG